MNNEKTKTFYKNFEYPKKSMNFTQKWAFLGFLNCPPTQKTQWVWVVGANPVKNTSIIYKTINYSPFCVQAKIIKLVGLKNGGRLSPINLVTFAGTQNGEYNFRSTDRVEDSRT